MFILGIILIVLGFVVYQWKAIERPIVFNKLISVIINLILIGLFAGGFYSLWQVNPLIVLTIISICGILWVINYFRNNDKSRAKEIFKIYRHIKLFHPKIDNEQIIRGTANAYFQRIKQDELTTRTVVDTIVEKEIGRGKDLDILNVAYHIIVFERPCNNSGSPNSRKLMKYYSKKKKATIDAYNVTVGDAQNPIEQPKLSKNTIEWAKSMGFNPDEMTNDQLAVFSEIEDLEKSGWAEKILYGISFIFIVLTIINLINFEFGEAMINAVILFWCWHIGYKIQISRINMKLHNATIMDFFR